MPLTIKEQIDIIEERVGPETSTGGSADVSLNDIVSQTASVKAKTFVDAIKAFDAEANPKAQEYKDKMLQVCFNAFNLSGSITNALVVTLVSIGAPSADIASIQALDQAGWELFVANNIFQAFEYVAGTTEEEKTAYDALP